MVSVIAAGAGLGSMQLVMMRAEREGMRAAGESEEAARDELWATHRQKAAAQIEQAEKALDAAKTDSLSFSFGALAGIIGGFASAMVGPLATPIIGTLPTMKAAATFIVKLAAATGAGAASGMMSGTFANKALAGVTAMHRNAASAAELRAFELEEKIAMLEANEKSSTSESERARALLRDLRNALVDLRKGDRERAQTVMSGEAELMLVGGGAPSAAMTGAVRTIRDQEIDAARDAKDLLRQAVELRISALGSKREAIAERQANETARAMLAIVELAVQVVALLATGGGSEAGLVVAKVASFAASSSSLVSAVITDDEARAKDREAEEQKLAAAKAQSAADDAEQERQHLQDARSRFGETARDGGWGSQGEKTVMAGTAGVVAVQRVIAELAEQEWTAAKQDRKSAREEKIAREEQAIDQRRSADDAQSTLEGIKMICAGVSAATGGFGLGQELAGVADATKNSFSAVATAINGSSSVGQAGFGLAYGQIERGRRRDAEEIDLLAKRAGSAEEDAKETIDDAKDRRRRAMELAVQAGRNRSLA